MAEKPKPREVVGLRPSSWWMSSVTSPGTKVSITDYPLLYLITATGISWAARLEIDWVKYTCCWRSMWPQKNPKSPKSLRGGREDNMNVYRCKMRCTKHLPITYPKLEYLFPLLYACKTAGGDKLFHSETTDKCFPDLRLPVAYGIHSCI